MMSASDRLIELVQGIAEAITLQIEEALPGLPWCEELRQAVREDLEAQVGPAVAGVVERLVAALGGERS